ncbi:alpha/beta hydrolase fold domain-containing protein [uncultured Flavobacterium sp.]|uniref:alpha/beta hydrolase fold domain-containing protein n=1 Tax=uncultured Flavobacterium sp. TaxID=165435 RepID=UPI0025D30B2C|nr:alpha/beta hydrolase fold domain-containing protein [uncultured Flavobacterium sp.]
MKNLLSLLFLFNLSINAQEFKTVTYFTNDSLKLELDLFLPKGKPVGGKTPLLIYVHGGGFGGGQRTDGHHICSYAAAKGYAAASITYSLYMKGKDFSCGGILTEKVKAIQIAANQLQQAVVFFIDNKERYNIDPAKIFISGSSAGAETVLHAAFWEESMLKMYGGRLPAGFKYAGAISGAGAIMDINLISKSTQVPVLLFHGSCDRTVPYATAAHHYCPAGSSGWLMLFGSHSIYNRIMTLGGSTHLVTYCGGGHDYSDMLFAKGQQTIIDFMGHVLEGGKEQSHTIIPTGKECQADNGYEFCNGK